MNEKTKDPRPPVGKPAGRVDEDKLTALLIALAITAAEAADKKH